MNSIIEVEWHACARHRIKQKFYSSLHNRQHSVIFLHFFVRVDSVLVELEGLHIREN